MVGKGRAQHLSLAAARGVEGTCSPSWPDHRRLEQAGRAGGCGWQGTLKKSLGRAEQVTQV